VWRRAAGRRGSGIGASGAARTSGPRRGGTLVIGQTSDITPKSLIGGNSVSVPIGRLAFNTLTEYDHKTLQMDQRRIGQGHERVRHQGGSLVKSGAGRVLRGDGEQSTFRPETVESGKNA
jgi:hypothetical protein